MQLLDIAFRSKSRAPMQTKAEAMVSKVAGVEGDFRGKPGKRQVTIMSVEQWKLACDAVATTLPWTVRRANLLVDGVSFNPSMVGQQIKIGRNYSAP
jgi:MOSC domain-containing protein YiiM